MANTVKTTPCREEIWTLVWRNTKGGNKLGKNKWLPCKNTTTNKNGYCNKHQPPKNHKSPCCNATINHVVPMYVTFGPVTNKTHGTEKKQTPIKTLKDHYLCFKCGKTTPKP